ncbi:hypothetical protein [Streptosporangium lutulentum]|uniref:Uncharacterized protein n=1 Tax=Streptosporangium lutulentum TaxID=1461250 RepID=A0ABT9QA98_9ACTN|nr:hypothetical protein [Streptosporangium lutulentum]MDP9843658.1 hypothetical protein [Streptosporangium lutulentum]
MFQQEGAEATPVYVVVDQDGHLGGGAVHQVVQGCAVCASQRSDLGDLTVSK